MQQWQYQVVQFDFDPVDPDCDVVQSVLNELGVHGWELATAVRTADPAPFRQGVAVQYVLKRPVPPKEATESPEEDENAFFQGVRSPEVTSDRPPKEATP